MNCSGWGMSRWSPATVQSAAGHGITLSTPLLTSRVTVPGAFTGTAIEGRPADCVKLAIAQILPRRPDLVVSGMNAGANVGINVIYSGTVAAAIEAGFLGLPAIAVSLYLRNHIPTDFAARPCWAGRRSSRFCRRDQRRGRSRPSTCRLLPTESPAGVKVVRQCTNGWTDTYEKRLDPRGRAYYWNSSVFTLGDTDPDTDVAALPPLHHRHAVAI